MDSHLLDHAHATYEFLPLAIGLAAQLPKILGGLFAGAKQKRLAKKIHPNDPTYEASPFAKTQLADAENTRNARMAGATNAGQNILAGQANQLSNVNRNATDSSQSLAVAAGVGGQTDQAFNQLAVNEGQYAQGQQQNYNRALQGMTGEHRAVFDDQFRKYQEQTKAKQDLMRSGMVNQQNAFNAIGSVGGMLAGIPGLGGDKTTPTPEAVGGGTGVDDAEQTAYQDWLKTRNQGGMMPRLRF